MEDKKLKEMVHRKIERCYQKAEKIFKRKLNRPTVDFNCTDKNTLGKATFIKNAISFSMDGLRTNPNDALGDTVPHEISHLLAFQVHGADGTDHGKPWKDMMKNVFGIEKPKAKAAAGLYSAKVAKVSKDFVYTCGCRDHFLSPQTHAIIESGRKALCKHCLEEVNFEGKL